jgi:LmbE family N-acetylglucosaminyl deacetylase/glycosyltransferase involved in cell wall biosynthesis
MLPDERQIVPYTASLLRGEKLLVLAPHPDDEVIGCGGLIRQHTRELRTVRVVVITDGGAAQPLDDPAAYAATREVETRAGLQALGVSDVQFLGFPDRGVEESREGLVREILRLLHEFAPDLIVVPSPAEVHPDHAALGRFFIESIQEDRELSAILAVTRVAFCEISQPIRPNTLVDISSEIDEKLAALALHETQLALRDYGSYAEGLNRYRAMTLPHAKAAEAFWVIDLPTLATTPWTTIRTSVTGADPVAVVTSAEPVSVVVRTKNRLPWLQQAIASIRSNGYPAEIVVVNDGGHSPAEMVRDLPGARLVEHETSRGRSEAMNSGVAAAREGLLAFLDDDDLFYPQHLETLARGISSSGRQAVYSDAVSTFMRMEEDGSFSRGPLMRFFAQDFDPDLLMVDNYIPLPTLMTTRTAFLEAGGFNSRFDLFEDWDFLIRLSRLGTFQRIPRITCEIRHFPSGGSAVLAAPEGTAEFHAARLRVWNAHRDSMTEALFERVFSRQKRFLRLEGELKSEAIGRAAHLERDVNRLERDKLLLLQELRDLHANYSQVSTERGALKSAVSMLEEREAELRAQIEVFDRELLGAHQENERLSSDVQRHLSALESGGQATAAMLKEIERLNGLLNQIYASKTWKLHRLAEAVRRR